MGEIPHPRCLTRRESAELLHNWTLRRNDTGMVDTKLDPTAGFVSARWIQNWTLRQGIRNRVNRETLEKESR